MGAPEQIAAMTSLLKPQNQALFRRIVTIWEDLFRPVLTEVITQGVHEGVFDTFDPEGVGDMIQGFAASMQTNLVDVLNAPDAKSRRKAIDASVKRLKLYGVATGPHPRSTRQVNGSARPQAGRGDGRASLATTVPVTAITRATTNPLATT